MRKRSFFIECVTLAIILMVVNILFQMPASGQEVKVLFSFDTSIQSWRGYQGPVKHVKAPSYNGKGSIQFDASIRGGGWSDNTIESPEINKDLSDYSEIAMYVSIPSDAPYGLRAQIFCKTGEDFLWVENPWVPLDQPGQWKRISIPTAIIETSGNLRHVRTIGAKIGGNIAYNGTVNFDRVELLTKTAQGGQPKLTIKIIEIKPNSRIIGRVFGIDPSQYSQYKVVVYVKTDNWYIHPYERGEEGLSFAEINRDGTWKIQTVKREFLADEVAALVVRKDYAPPSRVESLRQIDYIAIYREEGGDRLL